MKKASWVWMPHAGHFCLCSRCKFRLNTYVGGYIVSTVGELVKSERHMPNASVDDFDDVGNDRYETMVFEAHKTSDSCCPYQIDVQKEVETRHWHTPKQATEGHMALCHKWGKTAEGAI